MNFLFSVSQIALIAGLALTLAACEVGPDYQTPETSAPVDWTADETHDPKAEIDQQWWKNFNDPILTQLIDKAAADNFDLKIAEARIAQARAGVSSSVAGLLPSGDVKGTATREGNQIAFPDSAASPFGSLLKKPFNIFETGFDASWELDLFGGNRRAEESAEAQLQASEASRDDVRVSLMAEVARDYVAARSAQAQLSMAGDIVASRQKTLEITQQRFKVGQAPHLDVTQAEAALAEVETQIPALRDQIAQNEYSLDVLLGEQPGYAQKILKQAAPIPTSDKKLALAAPASVIAQRPDLRMAERALAAATAQQGVAVAQFFPKLSLSGFFGALNTSADDLLKGDSKSWMAGGSVIWPILSYGTLSANLDAADAQQQEALASYQKTVLTALADVERSLSAYQEQEKTLYLTESQVDKNKRASAVAEERFKQGATSRLEALDAERTLYTTQKNLLQAQASASQNLIALYKSLGGGWKKAAD